jgi:hypothetical protein
MPFAPLDRRRDVPEKAIAVTESSAVDKAAVACYEPPALCNIGVADVQPFAKVDRPQEATDRRHVSSALCALPCALVGVEIGM